MIINGLQKLTLLDYPGKTACTIFTSGCNFRCPYCHNAPLVLTPGENEIIPEEEIFSYLIKRQGILDGVCITGGEPLLQKDIEEFIRKIKELGYSVKLDTNGSFPDKLADLIDKSLVDYVAMDIKNCKEKYASTIDVSNFDISLIEKSVEVLKQGKIPYEFRTTVAKEMHTKYDIIKIGEWLKGDSKYFLQQYKISDNLIGNPMTPYDGKEMKNLENALKSALPHCETRGI
ncbi:MAG: anaerobic ribonucleoside-triphosphate reductase activating protein [Eubacteriales bacterium]|nr:anaerobic ribonucleoside-triphosphate reductase activating protein [Eubacteriales bacterium]